MEEEALRVAERYLRTAKELNVSAAKVIDKVGLPELKEMLVPITK